MEDLFERLTEFGEELSQNLQMAYGALKSTKIIFDTDQGLGEQILQRADLTYNSVKFVLSPEASYGDIVIFNANGYCRILKDKKDRPFPVGSPAQNVLEKKQTLNRQHTWYRESLFCTSSVDLTCKNQQLLDPNDQNAN